MTTNFTNNNFYGKISDNNINSFRAKLNFSIEDTEDRLKLVNDILSTDEATKYFEQVFDQDEAKEKNKKEEEQGHIKLNLSKEDSLYSESNVAKNLEKMADYLLFSLPKEERTEYKIYKDEDLFQKMVKEQAIDNEDSEVTDNVMHFLKNQNQNFKVEKKQRIVEADVEQINELKEYQSMGDNISFKLRRIALLEKIYSKTLRFTNLDTLIQEDIDVLSQYKLTTDDLTVELYKNEERQKSNLQKQSALIKEDMLYIKDCKKGTIYFKQPLADSTEVDYDMLDWNNSEQIDALLRIPPKGEDLQNDMVCIQTDLDKLIDDCSFSKRDLNILHMYRAGMTLEAIGSKLNIRKQTVNQYIDKIINNIIDTYNDQYEDWYYLEVEKGTYKTCSCCGEVKLATERHFSKDKKGKFGLKGTCKKCVSHKNVVIKLTKKMRDNFISIISSESISIENTTTKYKIA